MTKCKLDTCSKLIPSQCILFTGELLEGSYINLNGCDVRLNDYLSEVDRLLKDIKDNENVIITELNAANCGFTEITTLLSNPTNIVGDKVKTSATILSLLKIICSMQTRVINLENGGIFDLPLPDSIIDNLKCLSGIIDDPCDGPIKIKTLKDLLLIIIKKLCP